jgi:hypothetical protein
MVAVVSNADGLGSPPGALLAPEAICDSIAKLPRQHLRHWDLTNCRWRHNSSLGTVGFGDMDLDKPCVGYPFSVQRSNIIPGLCSPGNLF